ncbi:hypothetical protein [Nocardia xishanensis]|uniref:hypothetical protein n=1 Tax=Nocardia xishanensis TaxID=238964 RepID=UPI0034476F9A
MAGACTDDFRITFSATVVAAALTLIAWHGALLGMAEGAAVKALAAVWFILGWGVAPGALTAVVARSARRLPRNRAMSATIFVSLLITTGMCYIVYAYLTDPAFMDAAMGAPANRSSGADHAAHHPSPTAALRLSRVGGPRRTPSTRFAAVTTFAKRVPRLRGAGRGAAALRRTLVRAGRRIPWRILAAVSQNDESRCLVGELSTAMNRSHR